MSRPVRVGDLLSWSAEVNYNAPHARVFTARASHVDCPGLHKLATHLDGTPIEPSAPEPSGFEGMQIQGEHGPITVTSKPVPGALVGLWTHELDDISKRVRAEHDKALDLYGAKDSVDVGCMLENANARANQLSDECGSLATERDELLRENAVLRRKVERLERKGGKR